MEPEVVIQMTEDTKCLLNCYELEKAEIFTNFIQKLVDRKTRKP